MIWTPLCMDPDEWQRWQDGNTAALVAGNQAAYPCADCQTAWREARAAEGNCNEPERPSGQLGLDLFRAA